MTASLLYSSNCTLGEGAFWHPLRKSFMWVDIDGKMFFEYHWPDGPVQSWQVPHRPSLLALDTKGALIIAHQGGISTFDFGQELLHPLTELETSIPENRTNDGGVDSAGRLWIGTMNRQFKEAAGSLYCIDQHLLVEKKADGFTIPNGLAWSPDNKTMYHIESTKRIVRAYEFNPDTAHIHFIKIAIKVPEELGSPDGMCMDDEGMLWIAHWDGFGVYRWNPLTGQLLDKIEVPVPQVSCCAFGGENLDQLFITTARQDFTPQLEEKYPESGSVFVAKMKVRGSMKNKFYRKTKLPIESRLLH